MSPIDYKIKTLDELKEIQKKIEKSVIAAIEDWREHRVTRWNRLCSRTLTSLLPQFEKHMGGHIPIGSIISSSAELNGLKNVYQISGFPLNCTYTDINAITSLVESTDVHSNSDENVEFAFAVHCVPYPGGIVSAWMYVASLIRTHYQN